METERIRAVGGSSRKHARQRGFGIATGMDLQRVATTLMEPGHHDDVVAGRHPQQAICRPRMYFEPHIRRAFVTLFRRLAAQ